MKEIHIDVNMTYQEYLQRIPKDFKDALEKNVSKALYERNYYEKPKDFTVAYHALHSYIWRQGYIIEKDLQRLIKTLDRRNPVLVHISHELLGDDYCPMYLDDFYRRRKSTFQTLKDWFKVQGINFENIDDLIVKTEYISF